MPAEHALGLDPLTVLPLREPPPHQPPVLRPRPLATGPPAVQGDRRRPNAGLPPGHLVVVFGVVALVRQHPDPPGQANRLVDQVGEQRTLVGRAAADFGGGDEVALGVAGGRQQHEPLAAVTLGAAAVVVAGGVAALQAGGIDGEFRLGADQAAQAGAAERPPLELAEAPLLRSRCSALHSVE